MAQILSDRDAAEIEATLRWWRTRTDIRYQRRRRHGGGGGGARPIKAYAKAAAGSGNTIVCYKGSDSHDPADEITVTCELIGTSDLNTVTPRFKDGTMIPVWNDNGTWRPYFPFQKAVDC